VIPRWGGQVAKRVSVVIPTFNRKDVLLKAIKAHLAQSAIDEIKEILVVDDGSTDGTDRAIAALAAQAPFPLRRLYQSNRGQAAARNRGISEATGEIILFTDDDIIPAPDLLAEHMRWHDRYPEPSAAVLGFVEWSPEVRPTPFMRWFGLDGPLFAYAHFAGKTELDFRAFYSCNLSLKTELLRATGAFDEDFKGYGFEDAELGYRLQKNGMRLLYNRAALAYHYKRVMFVDACRRAEQVTRALRILEQKEAGKSLLELEGKDCETARPSRFAHKQLAAVLRPLRKVALAPFKLLIDSQIPLPWYVYRKVYLEAVANNRRQGQEI
jgi:glycosyltransferase involved in cell wall biosynthesis